MTDVNWELLRFKYEVLEQSLKQIATDHPEVPMAALEYAAQSWDQIPLVERGKEFDVEGDLRNDVVEQARIFSLLKQKHLSPKYIELETTLLHKAIAAAGYIDPALPQSTKAIRELSEILKTLLLEQKAIIGEDAVGGNEKKWEINFVTTELKEEDGESGTKTTGPGEIRPLRDIKKAL